MICITDITKKFVLQAEAEKPEQSRQKKICLAMKTLSLEQMEKTEGGKMSCGAALGFYAAAFIGAALATGGDLSNWTYWNGGFNMESN